MRWFLNHLCLYVKMEYLYKTVKNRTRTELTIERSKFITTVVPCNTREEADSFIAEIKSEFKDATHNVPAFIIGNKMELKWASDDGEPQGTAGPPILRYLEMNELTNIAVVVTRYFGGIKLGTGGLVRAYTQGAEQAVTEAGIVGAVEMVKFSGEMDYSAYNRLISYKFPEEIADNLTMGEPAFTEKVELDFTLLREQGENLKNIIMDVSGGKAAIGLEEETLGFLSLT